MNKTLLQHHDVLIEIFEFLPYRTRFSTVSVTNKLFRSLIYKFCSSLRVCAKKHSELLPLNPNFKTTFAGEGSFSLKRTADFLKFISLRFPNLITLQLDNFRLHSADVSLEKDFLHLVPNLKNLSITNCKKLKSFSIHLSSTTTIESLDFTCCLSLSKILIVKEAGTTTPSAQDAEIASPFPRPKLLTSLKTLNLSYTAISNDHLNKDLLPQLPYLDTLVLKGCNQIKQLNCRENKNLKTLNLRKCSEFTTVSINDIQEEDDDEESDEKYFATTTSNNGTTTTSKKVALEERRVQKLNLLGTKINNDDFLHIVETLCAPSTSSFDAAALFSLELRQCTNLNLNTQFFMFYDTLFQSHLRRLNRLYLARTNITDDIVDDIICRYCQELRVLEISNCKNLKHPKINIDSLWYLYLDESSGIDDELEVNCPQLCKFNILKIEGVSMATLRRCIKPCLRTVFKIDIRHTPLAQKGQDAHKLIFSEEMLSEYASVYQKTELSSEELLARVKATIQVLV